MYETTVDPVMALLRFGVTDGLSWSLYDTSSVYDTNPWGGYGTVPLTVYRNGSISAWENRVLVVSDEMPAFGGVLPQPKRDRIFTGTEVCFIPTPLIYQSQDTADTVNIKLVLGCFQCHQQGMDAHSLNSNTPVARPRSAVKHAEEILGSSRLSATEAWLTLLAVGRFPFISAKLVAEVLPLRLETVLDSGELLVASAPTESNTENNMVDEMTEIRRRKSATEAFWSLISPVPGMCPVGWYDYTVNDTVWWYLRRAGLAFHAELARRADRGFPDVPWRTITCDELAKSESESTPGSTTGMNCLMLLSGDYSDKSRFPRAVEEWAYCDLFVGHVGETEHLFDATLTDDEAETLEGLLEDIFASAPALREAKYIYIDAQRIRNNEPDFTHPVFVYDADRVSAFFPLPVGFFPILEQRLAEMETLEQEVPVDGILEEMGHLTLDLEEVHMKLLNMLIEQRVGLADLVPVDDFGAILAARTSLGAAETQEWIGAQWREAEAACADMVPPLSLLFTLKSDPIIRLALNRWSESVLTLVETYYDDPAIHESISLDWFFRLNGQGTA